MHQFIVNPRQESTNYLNEQQMLIVFVPVINSPDVQQIDAESYLILLYPKALADDILQEPSSIALTVCASLGIAAHKQTDG